MSLYLLWFLTSLQPFHPFLHLIELDGRQYDDSHDVVLQLLELSFQHLQLQALMDDEILCQGGHRRHP